MKTTTILTVLAVALIMSSCGNGNPEAELLAGKNIPAKKYEKASDKVTFVEIGSVDCIPCKMMQPIMKKIEQKYNSQLKVIFYDVWTPEGKPYGKKYGIRAIHTQVFLDKNGFEYFRHEGFFPQKKVEEALKLGGVK